MYTKHVLLRLEFPDNNGKLEICLNCIFIDESSNICHMNALENCLAVRVDSSQFSFQRCALALALTTDFVTRDTAFSHNTRSLCVCLSAVNKRAHTQ